MKKLMLFVIMGVFSMATYAQDDGMHIGINAGLPLGDSDEFYSFNVSANIGFLWSVSDEFSAGVTAGYSQFFGEDTEIAGFEFEIEDAGFLPVAASGRFNVSESFGIGADLGYAIGISPDGNDGGFYYAPRVHYGVSETLNLVLAYRGISNDGSSINALTLGVEFGI